jgi:type IV pilus assembly protein PilE
MRREAVKEHVMNQRGMTLVELMIVVVVVALLASIAIPGYRSYVIRSTRTEAKTALLRIGAAQEKFYLQNSFYTTTLGAGGLNLNALSENGNYTLALAADAELGDQGFRATARPADGSGQLEDADCTSFTLTHSGARTASPAGTQKCWR